MLTRRQFMSAGAGAIAAAALSRPGMAAPSDRPPNVVFILADDLGWGDLRCYGGAIAEAPNIERLAREGSRFTNFYVNAPVCSPSRTALTTGQFPSRLRIHSHFATPELNERRGMPQALDPQTTTLADCLRQAGYATGHFGKWHMGNISASEYGFDEHRTFGGGGESNWPLDNGFWRRSSELIVDEALQFIEKRREKPFYLNVWTVQPHAPLDPSEEQMRPFARFTEKRISGKFTTPFGVFYGAVAEMDRNVGRLLNRLDEIGLAENTIVVFSSDNGPEDIHLSESAHSGVGSPGPFRGRKRSLYEGGIRTPFVVRWPGRCPAGAVDTSTVLSGVDLLPSFCRLCGAKPPAKLPQDGEDLSSALLGKAQQRQSPLFWERRFRVLGDPINMSPMMAVRKGPWKMLMNPDGSRKELYDVAADPMEVDNVADAHPDEVRDLSACLMAWHKTLPESPIEPDAGAATYRWPAANPGNQASAQK